MSFEELIRAAVPGCDKFLKIVELINAHFESIENHLACVERAGSTLSDHQCSEIGRLLEGIDTILVAAWWDDGKKLYPAVWPAAYEGLDVHVLPAKLEVLKGKLEELKGKLGPLFTNAHQETAAQPVVDRAQQAGARAGALTFGRFLARLMHIGPDQPGR
jgi:hypothetical protein